MREESVGEGIAEMLNLGQDATIHSDGSVEPHGITIPGLPAGVVVVGYRVPKSGEFSLVGAHHVQKLDESWQWPNFIVQPAKGWVFKYSIGDNAYRPVRSYGAPTHLTAHFTVHDSFEEAAVRAINSIPGFEGFED